MEPLLHPQTKTTLVQLCQSKGGAYLLWGPPAAGKFLALKHQAEQTIKHPANLIIIDKEADSSVGIETIHQLTQQLALKSLNQSVRWVIIRDAERMTREAQNAFLKTLEEPPGSTLIWLTASDPSRLLPTILSRLQTVAMKPLESREISNHLTKVLGMSQDQAAEVTGLCQGAIGLATKLATEPETLQTAKQVNNLLQQLYDPKVNLYQRLKSAQKLQSESALELWTQLRQLAQQRLRLALDKDQAAIQRANRQLQLTHQLIRYLEANGNAKIALNQLVLASL